MFRFQLLLMCMLHTAWSFKMMTFNMYYAGQMVRDGVRKVASQINHVNPDIVALQDTGNETTFVDLMHRLGKGWSGVVHCHNEKIIISKHKILGLYEHVRAGLNVRVQLKQTGQELSVWSVDLSPTVWEDKEFGPYEAAREQHSSLEKILRGENANNGRLKDMVELIKHPEFVQQIKNSDNVPVIVAGGFSSPSHLDWTESTKDKHHGWVVDWPVTKLLSGAAGMTDSFREVYPDPKAYPGLTFTVYKQHGLIDREKDRIDYIFYRGSLRPTSSITFAGTTEINDDGSDNWIYNEWPSSHWSVITEFEPTSHKCENKPSFFVPSEYLISYAGSKGKCTAKIIEN